MTGVFSALKAIELLEQNNSLQRANGIQAKVSVCADRLLKKGLINGFRAQGVFCGMDIENELAKSKIELILWEHGVQMSCYRFDPVLRTILALSITDQEIESLFQTLEKVLADELAKVVKK